MQWEAVEAVRAALRKNIRTYVVGVGTPGAQEHFQELAAAGVKEGEEAIYRNGADGGAIEEAFAEIVDGQISCEVDLSGGRVIGNACLGAVAINGESEPLKCNEEWRLKDDSETVIEILGAACDRLKSADDPSVDAKFPCEVVAEAQ